MIGGWKIPTERLTCGMAKCTTLRAEADGHIPVVRSLRFDVDVELLLELPTLPVAAKTPAPGNPGRSRPKANRAKATHAGPARAPGAGRRTDKGGQLRSAVLFR